MIQSIIKRDGRVVLYEQNKIASAVLRALEVSGDGDASDAARVANDVQRELESKFIDQSPNIESIQDTVERQLMNHGFNAAAKAYILYRATRTRAREANTVLMKTIDEITNIDARVSDMKRDNANIDGNTAMGSMLQIGAAGAKAYNEIYLLRPEHAKAYRDGGCAQLGVSRAKHLQALKEAYPETETLLTRSPTRGELEATARYADLSLHSDPNVLLGLEKEAEKWNTTPGIILMIGACKLKESPRWLYYRGRKEEALLSLAVETTPLVINE